MNKEEILDVLDEDVYHVLVSHKSAVNINNSGTLNENKLERERQNVMMDAVRYLADELIKTRQGYPHGDVSEVDFSGDFVILKRKDYNLVKLFLENL